MEYNAWSEGNPPSHTVTIPFTRMLAGPVDYTPGIFKLQGFREDQAVHTTLAKQLALYVVIYSPVQMLADIPQNYEGHKAFAFFENLPVDWERSLVLNGEIGAYITMARQDRNSQNWFVGSITDEKPRSLSIALDFLDEGKTYDATIFQDGTEAHWQNNPQVLEIRSTQVRKGETMNFELAPGGGVAVKLIAK
jgi:alpha-glucosidase